MAHEIELKLILAPQHTARLRQHPVLQGQQPKTQALQNLYFDTPDGVLNQHKIALRIRRCGAQSVQTLKTKGRSQGGVHQRGEWEWPLAPEAGLNVSALMALQQEESSLPRLDWQTLALQETFRTDFQRTTWVLSWARPYAKIEVVLDEGEVKAGGRKERLSELELEILEGDPQALFALAKVLASHLALHLSPISKAQRALRLLQPKQQAYSPDRPQWQAQTPAVQVLADLLSYHASRWQSAHEEIQGYDRWQALGVAIDAVRQVRVLLHAWSHLHGRASTYDLRSRLNRLEIAYRPLWDSLQSESLASRWRVHLPQEGLISTQVDAQTLIAALLQRPYSQQHWPLPQKILTEWDLVEDLQTTEPQKTPPKNWVRLVYLPPMVRRAYYRQVQENADFARIWIELMALVHQAIQSTSSPQLDWQTYWQQHLRPYAQSVKTMRWPKQPLVAQDWLARQTFVDKLVICWRYPTPAYVKDIQGLLQLQAGIAQIPAWQLLLSLTPEAQQDTQNLTQGFREHLLNLSRLAHGLNVSATT